MVIYMGHILFIGLVEDLGGDNMKNEPYSHILIVHKMVGKTVSQLM